MEIQLMERIRNLNIHFFCCCFETTRYNPPPTSKPIRCVSNMLVYFIIQCLSCAAGAACIHVCVCYTLFNLTARPAVCSLLNLPPSQMGLTVNYLFSCCFFFFFFFFPSRGLPPVWHTDKTPARAQQNEKRNRGLLCERPLLLLTASLGRLYTRLE